MEMMVVWVCGAAGVLALLVRLATHPPVMERSLVRLTAISCTVAVVGWLATLPSTPPFQSGQGLGWGFAIGCIAAVLAMIAVWRTTSNHGPADLMTACAAAVGSALAGVSLVLVALRSVRVDALSGVLLGWLVVHALAQSQETDDASSAARSRSLSLSSLCVVAFCLACLLGVFRGGTLVASYTWTGSALVVSAGICLGCLVAAIVARGGRQPSPPLFPLLAMILVVAIAAWLAATRLTVSPWGDQTPAGVLWCTLIGLAAGLTLKALANVEAAGVSYALPLIGVAAVLPSYQLLAGMGIAVTALGASAVMLTTLEARTEPSDADDRTSERMAGSIVLLLALAAVRLAAERHGPALRPLIMSEHYALVALLLGMLVPTCTAPFVQQREGIWYRLTASGFWMVWPLVMMVVWGAKTLYGSFIGLGLAPVSSTYARGHSMARITITASLLGIMAQVQLAHWALRFSDLTRLERARLAGLVGLVFIVMVIGAELARRRAHRSA